MTRSFASRALCLVLCTSAFACSGDENAPTQITIEVTSDLKVPEEIDRVEIEVTKLQAPQHASADLTKQDLPRHLTLVHDGGRLGPIRITVTGYLGALKLVERKLEVSFTLRSTKMFSIQLERACLQNFCGDKTTCVEGKCQAFIGEEPGGAGNGGQGAGGMGGVGGSGGSGGGGTGGGGTGGTGGSGGSGGGGSGGIDSGPPVNHAPVCTITMPNDGQTLTTGLPVQLTGGCTDAESGALSGSALQWSSTHALSLGTGKSLQLAAFTSTGSETFTLCAQDPDDPLLTDCAQATVDVVDPDPPSANITVHQGVFDFSSPFLPTSPVSFNANVTGQQVTSEWSDTFVGAFGTGDNVSLSDPQIGPHIVTLVVTDNIGQSRQEQVAFTILPAGQSSLVQPCANVNSAVGGSVRALAVDSASQGLAEGPDAAPDLQRFDATDPSASATLAIMPTTMMGGATLTDPINALLIAGSLIYIGTNNGLVVCGYSAGTQISYDTCSRYSDTTAPLGLPSVDITAIARASMNSTTYLLAGTANGLFVASNSAGSNTCRDQDMNNVCDVMWGGERIAAVLALGNVFWFASTNSGLHSYDPTSGMVLPQSGAPSLQLSALAKDAGDMLWVGSDNGIGRFDPGVSDWTLWNTSSGPAPGLASNDVHALATTRMTIGGTTHDVVWIATDAGVSRFDPGVPSFITLTTADGLPSNDVRAIAVLPNGDKLLGTQNGVALYDGS